MKRILVHAVSEEAVKPISTTLMDGYALEFCNNSQEAQSLYSSGLFEFAIFELGLLLNDGVASVIKTGFVASQLTPLVIVCSPEESESVFQGIAEHASACLVYPIMPSEITLTFDRLKSNARIDAELQSLREKIAVPVEEVLGRSRNALMQAVLKQVKTAALTNATILINGETGVGKSMLAKFIHEKSRRNKGPFISVNCGAIPDSLVESELFGHEKGAFTGAIRRKMGQFEIADGGTIFLDEISALSFHVQVKLLHVLQDKQMVRVGGEKPEAIDVRVIAASNDNLEDMCTQNQFRRDLYYRLNVFPVSVPPLRRRKEDIPALAYHFIHQFNIAHNKSIEGITKEVLDLLVNYDWPGNIRELQNVLERAHILEEGAFIASSSLSAELVSSGGVMSGDMINTMLPITEARKMVVNIFERRYLSQILTENRGSIQRSALQAGISTRQLQKLMIKHHIKKEAFR